MGALGVRSGQFVRPMVSNVTSGAFAKLYVSNRGAVPEQANVRVVPPSVPYPTIPSLVSGMAVRRDLAEQLARLRAIVVLIDVLDEVNEFARADLMTKLRVI